MDKINAVNPVLVGTTEKPKWFADSPIVIIPDGSRNSSFNNFYIWNPFQGKGPTTVEEDFQTRVSNTSVEILYSDHFTGVIEGQIAVENEETPYSGNIIVYYKGTNNIVISSYVDDTGYFKITGLNPNLKYSVKCIPLEVDKYESKIVDDFAPTDDLSKELSLIDLDQNIDGVIPSYEKIVQIKNYNGDLFVSVLNAEWLTVQSLSNGVYKIYGTPPGPEFSYIINCMDAHTIPKSYSREYIVEL